MYLVTNDLGTYLTWAIAGVAIVVILGVLYVYVPLGWFWLRWHTTHPPQGLKEGDWVHTAKGEEGRIESISSDGTLWVKHYGESWDSTDIFHLDELRKF